MSSICIFIFHSRVFLFLGDSFSPKAEGDESVRKRFTEIRFFTAEETSSVRLLRRENFEVSGRLQKTSSELHQVTVSFVIYVPHCYDGKELSSRSTKLIINFSAPFKMPTGRESKCGFGNLNLIN